MEWLWYYVLPSFFQAIRHELLNQDHRPCNPNPEYNFGKCVETSIKAKVGCQPPWTIFKVELPPCHNLSQLIEYRWYRYSMIFLNNIFSLSHLATFFTNLNTWEEMNWLRKHNVYGHAPSWIIKWVKCKIDFRGFQKICEGNRRTNNHPIQRCWNNPGSKVCNCFCPSSDRGWSILIWLSGCWLWWSSGPFPWLQFSHDLGLCCDDYGENST